MNGINLLASTKFIWVGQRLRGAPLMNLSQANVDAICRDIYRETASFPPIAAALSPEIGFEILMGQPLYKAPVLFIGYQPGDGALSPAEAREAGYERDWVIGGKSQYATESWLLARKLRAIFGEKNLHLLDRSVGLNAIFIRAKNVIAYNAQIDALDRKRIEAFCKEKNELIINTIQPKKIVVLGFGTMNVFGASEKDVVGENSKAVTKLAEICGIQALAVRHLTGARFTTKDYKLAQDRIRNFLNLD